MIYENHSTLNSVRPSHFKIFHPMNSVAII